MSVADDDVVARRAIAGTARPRRLRTALVLAVLAGLVALGLASTDRIQLALGIGYPQRTAPPMLVIAHRGDVDRFPEDTLEAIRAAAEGSADGIEFDVHRSADGIWYVIHDTTLDRTTDLEGPVSSLTSSEIDGAKVDGGLGFRADEHLGIGVPRLAAVLDVLGDYTGLVIVDMQHAATGDAGDVAQLLRGRPATVLVRSRDDIRAIRALDPQLMVVARAWIAPDQVDGLLMDATTEATIGRVRGADLPVFTYVDDGGFSNDESGLIRRAWAANVFAFLSKHPEPGAATVTELSGAGRQWHMPADLHLRAH